MNKRIPIRVVKDIAREFKLDQVIMVAYERDAKKEEHMTHVVTYGKTKVDCLQAAQGGNVVKKALGWPETLCDSLPARVRKDKYLVAKSDLQNIVNWTESRNGEIEATEQALKEIKAIVSGILRST